MAELNLLQYPEVTDFGARLLPDDVWEQAKKEAEINHRAFGTPVFHSPGNTLVLVNGKPVTNAVWGGLQYGYLLKASEY